MEALRITDRLVDYLISHDKETGQIHSIFEGAFNIVDSKGQLLGILSSKKDLSPFSMVVNCHEFNTLGLAQGDLCQLGGNTIHFQNSKVKIEIIKPEIANLSLDSISPTELSIQRDKLELLKDRIISNGSLSGIAELIKFIEIDAQVFYKQIGFEAINEYSDFIKNRLLDLLNSVLNDEYEMFKNSVQKTVGFGPGLTPSTDDFLAGIIIMMRLLKVNGFYDKLDEINNLCVGKTTKISEEMLKHASKGYGPESYKNFIESLFNKTQEHMTDEVSRVIQIGSTSGTDFLFGVYCMAIIHTEKLRRYKNGQI